MRSSPPVVLMGSRLPARLSDLSSPPSELYLRGELPRGPCVAIVGTRRATRDALAFAKNLAAQLVHAGVSILSGGALGIDTAAHRGALAVGGTTLVVAPAGFAVPYPPQNAALFRKVIASGGGYAALVPDDQPATQAAFFRRNACLVALAHAVVVVQAGFRSGARNAAAQARALGRPLFAVPFSPWVGKGRGCVAELRAGAAICEGPSDVLHELERRGCQLVPTSRPDMQGHPSAKPAHAPELDGIGSVSDDSSTEARVLSAVRDGASHADVIASKVGLSASATQQVLLTLRLRGVLVCDPTGTVALCKCSD